MPVKKSEIWQSLIQKARALHDAGKSYDEIIKELLSKHNDDALIYAIIKKIKSENYAVKLKEGKKLLLIGSLFMFTGFFITCINFHSQQSVNFAMYGFTIAGLLFVFAGLLKVF